MVKTLTAPSRSECLDVLERVFATARSSGYRGYSKHDALNAPWLESLAGDSKLRRLVAIQTVMRSPVHIRPLIGVRTAVNPKGHSLFARALLARYRVTGATADADEARMLLGQLLERPSQGFPGLSWGYPYPWQDGGFFAPRDFPNRVVTSFVGQALLDAYETLTEARYLDAAKRVATFLLDAPKTLYEDDAHRCVSYVPRDDITWIVMDVSALAGAFTAHVASHTGDTALMHEAGRLVRYVVSKQTDDGAWFYAEPPSASRITHDNYHTGFILDAIAQYSDASGSSEFDDAYERGIRFYEERLFEPDGAPRFMSDQRYPYDIHGAAQGIITFSLHRQMPMAAKVCGWTLANMWDPRSGWFYYQKRRGMRTKIRELRWCQAWMSLALATYIEAAGR